MHTITIHDAEPIDSCQNQLKITIIQSPVIQIDCFRRFLTVNNDIEWQAYIVINVDIYRHIIWSHDMWGQNAVIISLDARTNDAPESSIII